jgi:thiol-disulfide isomerase/thioredoxin
MKHVLSGLFALSLAVGSLNVAAAAAIGQPAPGFVGTDTAGKAVSLTELRGKTVVLEWVNPGCPYVRKHYGAQNLQATQKAAVDRGVVWLAVNSTAQDATDYLSPEKMAGWMKEQKASATSTLMDADGRIGRAYGARTTPHLYIIDAKGVLAYAGAIDSKPSARAADIPGATNHVNQALGELLAGKPVSTPATQPYGCTVKYSSM